MIVACNGLRVDEIEAATDNGSRANICLVFQWFPESGLAIFIKFSNPEITSTQGWQ